MTRYMIASALAVVLLSPAATMAQTHADMAQVEVLEGWRTDRGTHMAAIRVTLAPGWKTYWRAPGDAGIPAQFDWAGSDNLAGFALHWPVPELFHQNGMTSVGYRDQVTIPIELTARDGAAPIALVGRIDMGVCEDICVPISVQVSADLPAGSVRKDERIGAALADRPMTAREAGVGAVRCTVAPARSGMQMTVSVEIAPLGGNEFAVVELPGAPVWVSEAAVRRDGAMLHAKVDLVAERGTALTLDRSQLRLTLLGQRGAVDIRGCG